MAPSGFLRSVLDYLQPYHIIHWLIILLYPLTRFTPLKEHVFPSKGTSLASEETHVLMMLGTYILIKGRRMPSLDAYFSHMFFVVKAAFCVIFFRENMAIGFFYLILSLVVTFAFSAPSVNRKYQVVAVTGPRLKNLLSDRGPNGTTRYTLLELYAPWSPPCNLIARDLAELSKKYSSPNLKFIKANVATQEDIAELYGVEVSVRSKQLPTFILFENGREIRRMPHVFSTGAIENCQFSQELLEGQFELAARTLGQSTQRDAEWEAAQKNEDAKTNGGGVQKKKDRIAKKKD